MQFRNFIFFIQLHLKDVETLMCKAQFNSSELLILMFHKRIKLLMKGYNKLNFFKKQHSLCFLFKSSKNIFFILYNNLL